MDQITILSPHRDDAIFSLSLALIQWAAASIPLQVVNFFTESAYAPLASAQTITDISSIRRKEDEEAIAAAHSNIKVVSLGFLDAPLRLHVSFDQITQPQSAAKVTHQELVQLSQIIQQHGASGLVIAPLSLGNHVDHHAVHKAACQAISPERLAFYEDLPYATWTSTKEIQARVSHIQQETKWRLDPVILRVSAAVERKRRLACFYMSQITFEEADKIARFAENYEDGERLWMPASSKGWQTIKSLATELPQKATLHPPNLQLT